MKSLILHSREIKALKARGKVLVVRPADKRLWSIFEKSEVRSAGTVPQWNSRYARRGFAFDADPWAWFAWVERV